MEPYRAAYAGKCVLVTGAAGAIGSNLCKELLVLGARVLALDDLSASNQWNVPLGAIFVRGDILDESKLSSVFAENPKIVFHLAAFFANQNSVEHPERDLMVNGVGTLRILEYARRCNVERFIFGSTSALYDGIATNDSPRFAPSHLTSPYQISKLVGEKYCTFFHEHCGLQVVKARFFNSFGPGEVPGKYRNVIPNFVYLALKQKTLPITGTGDETRDFTYVEDIVDGLLRSGFYESAIGQELSIASGIETSIGNLARSINQMVGNSSGICYQPRRVWDQQNRRRGFLDHTRETIGYEPRTELSKGLQRTVRWFRDHWTEIEATARF
jgi:UDP-glucose 4-epimerase